MLHTHTHTWMNDIHWNSQWKRNPYWKWYGQTFTQSTMDGWLQLDSPGSCRISFSSQNEIMKMKITKIKVHYDARILFFLHFFKMMKRHEWIVVVRSIFPFFYFHFEQKNSIFNFFFQTFQKKKKKLIELNQSKLFGLTYIPPFLLLLLLLWSSSVIIIIMVINGCAPFLILIFSFFVRSFVTAKLLFISIPWFFFFFFFFHAIHGNFQLFNFSAIIIFASFSCCKLPNSSP